MNYIRGKLKKIIFHNNESGYVVALFRVRETDDAIMKDKVNKSITVTGVFTDVNIDISMTLYGSYVKNERFGMQYAVSSYEIDKPTTKEAIIEFLASSFIDGCGEKTAKRIVDRFGEETLDKIKEDRYNLLLIEGLTPARADKIYNSLINYNKSSEAILKFQNLGFSIEECSKIYNKFKDRIDEILGDSFYDLKEIIDFKKLDSIYVTNFDSTSKVRLYACFLETLQILSYATGDTYYYREEISSTLVKEFNIVLDEDNMEEVLNYLQEMGDIFLVDRKIYLAKYYEMEENIANTLKKIDNGFGDKIKDIE